jgi:hypothetical protein
MNYHFFLRSLIVTAICIAAGCTWIGDTIKSELSAYAEPTDGPLAHIRLAGSRDVKVYPNSTCVSTEVPGSGYPAGPQMGGQRKRDLGMPKPPGLPRHYVEMAARAGEPITAGFSFYTPSISGGIAGTGASTTRSSSSCYAASAFVPEAGQHYEMTAQLRGNMCIATVVRLEGGKNGGPWLRVPVPSEAANGCNVMKGDSF